MHLVNTEQAFNKMERKQMKVMFFIPVKPVNGSTCGIKKVYKKIHYDYCLILSDGLHFFNNYSKYVKF
jgi:hypothetical protein